MKQYINLNILWTDLFVTALKKLGVEHASISPGSRNTPLTISFQRSNKIKSFIHVDERSNGFFSLGLANRTNKPVVVVTTSGTAAAELYPSIIEAFQQKIPMLICTADRPPYLLNTGANQTINQIDIFKNHIVDSFSLELPSSRLKSINHYYSQIRKAYSAAINSKGPVHINFPFEMPFEPSAQTENINKDILKRVSEKFRAITHIKIELNIPKTDLNSILGKIRSSRRRLILVGPFNDQNINHKLIFQFAEKINALVFADGLSGIRFGDTSSKNLIVNHPSFLRTKNVIKKLDPDLIIQIGSAPTSKHVLGFYKNSGAFKIIVNKFGELKDPSRTTDKIISADYKNLFTSFNEIINRDYKFETDHVWINNFIEIEKLTNRIKDRHFKKVSFPFEGKIITEVINNVPENANIMISNSLPVRDFDAFANHTEKKLRIFSNRGASGIDGIISTAAGINGADHTPTFLIIGDLSFYHDLTGLLALKKYSIPLTIILLNNNGGGIFELLPISKEKIDFRNYFKTPLGIDFESIVSAFKGNYYLIKNWTEFRDQIKRSAKRKLFSVLEIRINSKSTLNKREAIWNEIKKATDSFLNEN